MNGSDKMTIGEAEWIVSNKNNYPYETVQKAKRILEAAPFETFNCNFCEIECFARKNTEEHTNQLCYKCWLRMKA